ncbi:MAG TPA: hypothetical protein VM557_02660 [Thermoanaerobaculia bacterium]|nr:hypothetical protein [Thermoanaerobaculia bacterium]
MIELTVLHGITFDHVHWELIAAAALLLVLALGWGRRSRRAESSSSE